MARPTRDRQTRAIGLAQAVCVSLWVLGLALAADAAFTLPRAGRAILWQLWFCGTLLLIVRRLRDPGHFSRAVLVQLSGLVVAGLVSLAASGSSERLQRFFPPWPLTVRDQPYRLVVPAGHVIIARDTPLTLSAYWEPTPPQPLKETHLLVRSSEGQLTRYPLETDEAATLWQTLPRVQSNFDYCFQSGTVASEWYRVRVSDPVHLLPNSEVLIRPPSYAEAQIAARSQRGWSDFEALASSQFDFTLRFNRPASRVQLTWRPLDAEPSLLTVNLDADGLAGVARLEARESGVLHLELFSTEQLLTEYIAAVRVQSDQPPRFEKIVGLSPGIHEARPDDRVLIEFAARDDLQLSQAWMEYTTSQAEDAIHRLPLKMPGLGTNRVDGVSLFNLQGKVREGDTLRFRLVLTDHRHLLREHLGPQQVTYPASGWLTLKIQGRAKPLAEQEIIGQRDRVLIGLTRAESQLAGMFQFLRQVPINRLGDGALAFEVAVPLREVRQQLSDWTKSFRELERELLLVPAMRPLASEVTAIIQPTQSLPDALKQVESEPSHAAKSAKFRQVLEQLETLQQRLTRVKSLNLQLAERRAALRALRELASDQRDLAEFGSPEPAAQQQANLQAQLARLIHDQPLLRQSVQAADLVQRRQLLVRTRQQLEAVEQLDLAIQRLIQAEATRLFRRPLGEQTSITRLAEQLAETTATAARITGSAPLRLDAFQQAQEALRRGKADAALAEQEKACRELERLAQALGQAVTARGEPREAARQLARWLDDWRRRVAFAPPPRLELLREWEELQAALNIIKVSDGSAAYQQTMQQLLRDLNRAAEDIRGENPAESAGLQHAVDSLGKLADLTPTRTERLRNAKPKLEALRRELENLRAELERLTVLGNRLLSREELNTVAAQFRTWQDRFKLVTVPGLEPRQANIWYHVEQAIGDLQASLPEDALASLFWARKQLDSLRLTLDGAPPAEDQLYELLQHQQQVHERLMSPRKWSVSDLQELEADQRERTKALSRVNLSDIAMTQADLLQQSESLAQAFRLPEALTVCRAKSAEFLAQFESVTKQVRGYETDLARVQRLTRQRDQLWLASQSAGRPFTTQSAQDAARRADQQANELRLVRVGAATLHRRAALDALKKLREATDGDRRPMLHQAVLEALQKLENQMHNLPPRPAWAEVVPKVPSESDRLRLLTGRGRLPSLAAAEQFEALLKVQQTCRDATALALAEFLRGPNLASQDEAFRSPPGSSPFVALLSEQVWQARHPELQSFRLMRELERLTRDLLATSTELRRYAFQQNSSVPEAILNLATELDTIRISLMQSLELWKARQWNRAASPWQAIRPAVRQAQMLAEDEMRKLPTSSEPAIARSGAALATAQDAMRDVLQKLALPSGSPLAREAMHAAADALTRAAQSLP